MRITALCNNVNPPMPLTGSDLKRLLDSSDLVVLLGGISLRGARSLKAYSITGLFDDHYVAKVLDEATIFVESKAQYLSNEWYLVGIGGRDPIANIRAIERILSETPQGTHDDGKILIASYFCPYSLCDKSLLGGRRGLRELLEFMEKYPVRAILSCECGPGVIEYKGVTTMCLGGGDCIGVLDIGEDDKIVGRVHCGDNRDGAFPGRNI